MDWNEIIGPMHQEHKCFWNGVYLVLPSMSFMANWYQILNKQLWCPGLARQVLPVDGYQLVD
jgi:hypothetical protein